MMILKSERDLELMRPACAVAGTVLEEIAAFIKPGVDDAARWTSLPRRESSRTARRARFWAIANTRAIRAFR